MENNETPVESQDQNQNISESNSYQNPIATVNNDVGLKKEVKSYKKLLVAAVVVGLIAVGVLGYLYLNRKTVATYNAEVSLVSGQVEKSETTGVWIELKSTDSVKQGDKIRVNGVGKAVITLDDGSAIRLTDNSRILLSSLDPKDIQITNENGEVYTRVVKADRPFVVKVDDESYKAMGTAYKTINLESEKGVFVYESKVQVISANIEVDAGKKYYDNNQANADLIGKVSDISDDEVVKDEFIQWNKEQDLKNDEFKQNMGVLAEKPAEKLAPIVEEKTEPGIIQPKPEAIIQPVSAKITLTASTYENGIALNWTTAGFDATKGFKVVKSTSENPVYPGNDNVYLSSGSTRGYKWQIKDGATYYFRVCQYTGSGCNVYSNNVKITAPYVADGVVKSMVISGTDKNVSWTVDGYSDQGFKVVYSKNPSPTYPLRTGDKYEFYSNAEVRTGTLTAFDGAGTYYVRVCEYLGGKCGIYSNEITVNL